MHSKPDEARELFLHLTDKETKAQGFKQLAQVPLLGRMNQVFTPGYWNNLLHIRHFIGRLMLVILNSGPQSC